MDREYYALCQYSGCQAELVDADDHQYCLRHASCWVQGWFHPRLCEVCGKLVSSLIDPPSRWHAYNAATRLWDRAQKYRRWRLQFQGESVAAQDQIFIDKDLEALIETTCASCSKERKYSSHSSFFNPSSVQCRQAIGSNGFKQARASLTGQKKRAKRLKVCVDRKQDFRSSYQKSANFKRPQVPDKNELYSSLEPKFHSDTSWEGQKARRQGKNVEPFGPRAEEQSLDYFTHSSLVSSKAGPSYRGNEILPTIEADADHWVPLEPSWVLEIRDEGTFLQVGKVFYAPAQYELDRSWFPPRVRFFPSSEDPVQDDKDSVLDAKPVLEAEEPMQCTESILDTEGPVLNSVQTPQLPAAKVSNDLNSCKSRNEQVPSSSWLSNYYLFSNSKWQSFCRSQDVDWKEVASVFNAALAGETLELHTKVLHAPSLAKDIASSQLHVQVAPLSQQLVAADFEARQRLSEVIRVVTSQKLDLEQKSDASQALTPLRDAITDFFAARFACRKSVLSQFQDSRLIDSLLHSSPFSVSLFPDEEVKKILNRARSSGRRLSQIFRLRLVGGFPPRKAVAKEVQPVDPLIKNKVSAFHDPLKELVSDIPVQDSLTDRN
ncbi:uncharacterized protein [Procambarus clarkii]|uniref:uncharacterized protein n=1 Tax=Procambarus clarkii TaxID=6728 RepID=UPI001E674F39|nr:uncharacterized protein LOC123767725 [Procambarus clarkii]XP_045613628.1 uncharacterized protein LOC123767725 [Procambarus clarkii]